MKLGFNSLILISYFLGAGILLAVGISAIISFNSLKERDFWVEHTHQVIKTSENFISLIKDVESSARGYLLSEDSIYLETYIASAPSIQKEIIKLRKLTKDNPTQLKKIDFLSAKAQEQLNIIQQGLLHKNDNNMVEQILAPHSGKLKIDEIRHVVASILAMEEDLLKQRKIKLEDSITLTERIIYFTIFFALTLVFFTLFYVKRNLDIKEQYEKKLENLNKDLSSSNKELSVMNEEFQASIEEINSMNEQLSEVNVELKNKNDLLGKYSSELESVNKELEAFSYSISHDLRAPLRTINGFANILSKEYKEKLDDNGIRLLGIVMDGTKKMGMLIDDLLHFFKISKSSLQISDVGMKDLAYDVTRELLSHYPDIKFEIKIDELPNAMCDLALMKQVWVNLIGNALKYSSKREAPQMEISVKKDEDRIVYCIQDNGVGFDMKYSNKLFKIFQKLHKAEEYSGTGVGLAIVNRIISRHNGKIWVESKLNEGTTFCFYVGALVDK